ncbi:DUF2237 domain-containing protein [Devosia sp. XJ19-1]|uniref:DUF2237 domain-containing protein n=1 Tax=Devosia ureilytica TaxID=2952754 RepID=A0A9Q4AP32_9HYPH|nr:DUF2237 domain-containing protein [Devosia ureilytica]MCP8883495.1 DUF2237 domain-containing protein [Devosia ureilytica]MCP8887103.1 DUF2237 domain-containing protein [Devosia ureilytica]
MTVVPRIEGQSELNVLGEPLQPCSHDPLTGYFRSGYCAAGPEGGAVHLVCIEATEAFLAYSSSAGNDLSTPRPEFGFPGLVAGNRWCLVAGRWAQAQSAGMAPRVYLRATNQRVLDLIPLATLKTYALDLN